MAATLPYPFYNVQDQGRASLSASLDATATSFAVQSGQGAKFSASHFVIHIDDECIYCATRSTDTLSSLERGYNGTTAATHAAGAIVYQSWDTAHVSLLQANIAEHTHNKADITAFAHTHAQADITNLTTDLTGKQATSEKGQANGYASLDGTGIVPSAQLPAGGSDPFATFVGALASDVSTGANTTPVSVTGLVFTYVANSRYVIEVFGRISSALATTGCGLQIDLSSAVDFVSLTFFHQLANTGTLAGGNSIADDASAGVSSGIPAAAGVYPFFAAGVLDTAGNTGTAQLRYRAEVAAVTTIKAGTVMRVHKVA